MRLKTYLAVALACAASAAHATSTSSSKDSAESAALQAVQADAQAHDLCVNTGLAVLRGYELRRANQPEDSLANEAMLIAGSDQKLGMALRQPLALGYSITEPLRIGTQAIEVRESCLQEQLGENPLTGAAIAMVLAHKSSEARVACAGKLAGRPASSSELQYLGCLPSTTSPTLPNSLGGGGVMTELVREGSGFAVAATANLKGAVGIPACMLLNNSPGLSSHSTVRCKVVDDYAVLTVTRIIQDDKATTRVGDLDELSRRLLEEYLGRPPTAQ